jgi:amidase
MTDLIYRSTTELATMIRSGEVSAVEVLDAHLAQIEQHNTAINAVVILDAEAARQRAQEADAALARGAIWGPLHGVPFTLKDAHSTAGMRTTTGAPWLDHVPEEDSAVTVKLRAAGGILFGKTNVAEMLGDPGQSSNSIFGRTNNPWNVERTPGGSSGGPAAAVAAGMTPFDIGTDLAGSIRIPAHFCGIFGLKPTENRVSLVGLIPGLPPVRSLRMMSCIGPMARSIEDLMLLYSIIAGPDGQDTDVEPVPVETGGGETIDLSKLRIAFAPTFGALPVSTDIREALSTLVTQLRDAGATVEEAPLPALDFEDDLESAGNLIGMLLGAFQPDEGETPTSLATYFEALHRRDQSIIAWEAFFDQWDVLLCPPSLTTAFPHTETGAPLTVDSAEMIYWMVNAHTTLFNYSGHPALVMPCTQDRDGLPIGVQLVGKRWSEGKLMAIAKALTAVTGEFQRPAGY